MSTDPLDLHAVEAQHATTCASQEQRYGTSEVGEVYPLAARFPCDCWPQKFVALLTALRETRAALQRIHDGAFEWSDLRADQETWWRHMNAIREIAAPVLAQVRDAP
jgi:hypothetical protein